MSINLTGAELVSINLTGAELFNADLTGAELFNADLTGAELFNSNLTGASLENTNLTGVQFYHSIGMMMQASFIERNYAQILFFKLFNVKKLGFRCDRGPWESRWKYTRRYFFSNLHLLFIKWNFKPDCKNAQYDKSTTFPKWLDPVKAGMKEVPQEPEKQADVKASQDAPAL